MTNAHKNFTIFHEINIYSYLEYRIKYALLIFIICQFLSICLNPRRSFQISVSCEILLVCMYHKRYLYREVLYVNGDGTSALNDLHIITDTRVSRRYGTRKNFGFNLIIKMCLCTSKTLSYSVRVLVRRRHST